MCGRYARRSDKQRIAELFAIQGPVLPDFGPSWNLAPQTFQPVVRLNRDTGEREIALMRWGITPFWPKTRASDSARSMRRRRRSLDGARMELQTSRKPLRTRRQESAQSTSSPVGGFTEEEFADPSLKTIVHCVRKSGASCIETAFDRVFHLG
jgi:putative SOS response-associated peptidase YedK